MGYFKNLSIGGRSSFSTGRRGASKTKLTPGAIVNFEVTGIESIDSKLAMLPKVLRNRIARKAARRAAIPLLEAARREAPVGEVDGGQLRDSHRIRPLSRRAKRQGKVGVQVTTGKEHMFEGEAFYGAFVGLGTAYITPNDWLGRAADQTEEPVRQIFIDETKNFLDRELAAK